MVGSRRALDEGVERLKGIIGDMASTSLNCLVSAVKKLSEDVESGEVRKMSDQLQFMREEAGDLAIELLARYQPMATDLRLIRSCIQVAYDFSRMGRYALDIVEAAEIVRGHGCSLEEVEKMYMIVLRMVEEAGRAFLRDDIELAEKIRRMDDEVDKLYRKYLEQLAAGEVKEDATCLVATALIMRYLERVADHTCYIADSIIYTSRGKI